MKELEQAMDRIGTEIDVESSSGLKKGRAVIYPVRGSGTALEQTDQGKMDVGLFSMFAESRLLEDSGYGAMIYQGRHRYRLIRKDAYSCRIGGYTKALLRKIVEE